MYIIGVLTAMLTSFYMFRMLYLTFYGKFRGTHEQEHHLHESPPSMTVPLIILAVLSIIGGLVNVPTALHGNQWLQQFLAPVLERSTALVAKESLSESMEMILMGVSVAAALLALLYAYIKYIKNSSVPVADGEERPALVQLSYNKFYIDEFYDLIIRRPLDAISSFFYKIIDLLGIDGIVNGLGKGAVDASNGFRLLQTGNVGFYIFMMVVGIVSVLVYLVFKF